MPRRPRVLLSGVAAHIVHRGNNRSACFFRADDYRYYLHWLKLHAREFGCLIHAYVLMTNHVHLLATGYSDPALSQLMKAVAQRHTQRINRLYARSGSLWEGRFHSSLVDSDHYVLACHRYLEMNPVRAGIVGQPGDYPWSSFLYHAWGRPNDLLNDHPSYIGLSDDSARRLVAYRQLFEIPLPQPIINRFRRASLGNWRIN